MSAKSAVADLRPGEGRMLLKLLVLPVGLIFGSLIYAGATGTPYSGSSPVYIVNDLADLGSLLFVAVIAYFTGKTRARAEMRGGVVKMNPAERMRFIEDGVIFWSVTASCFPAFLVVNLTTLGLVGMVVVFCEGLFLGVIIQSDARYCRRRLNSEGWLG